MTNRRPRTFLALAALLLAQPARGLIDETLDVLFLSKEIGEKVLSSWDIIGKPFNATGGVELPFIKRRETQILSRLAQVTNAIERLELNLQQNNAVALMLSKNSGKKSALELRLHEMTDLLSRVSSANRQMREYVRLQQTLERSTLENFAEWCVSHDPGALPGLLERIHALVVPPHRNLLGRGVLQLILEDLQDEHPDVCELQLSQHQLIYDTYNTISLTEIKGYAMMQFSWMLLRIYGRGNYTQEASLTRQRYGERTALTAAAARAALAMASRDLYRCDPPEHKEGETYAEVTRLLQGYIENEVDMNSEGTCRDNCAAYTVAENHGCFKDQFCSKQPPCKGRILNCKYIDSDMWVCPAGRNSNRRYEWIEYENGRTFGTVGHCKLGAPKVDSWWRWLFWHCSYCMCLCDEASEQSDRYFSLWDTTSDVKNNKVVTGLRLVKLGRVFHLQISEGTLGERGSVIPGDWVPIQKFDPSEPGMRDGVDYHKLTYERRAIDLDELDSPAGHILTGVRFRMLGAHLHFEIRSTPFNYATGRLAPERSQWISNDNTDGAEIPRKRLELYKPDIPIRSNTPLPVDSSHDQFIEFTHTDYEADAAQSTVPFVDIQPVMPMKGAGLTSGAGIIHRGARGSGGFIGVKLFTYDYSAHIKAEPPASEFDSDSDTTEFVPIVN
ncbi:uncharacterized protein LOC114361723 isoform X2 [Ostrinia furnacalis]|uniref:uncharacterized protein LOC114361723 isoform X1 n=1 Tax=Ostrinia furnacalis TaxID=93504 RepID=UPI00103F2E54|nr:uncharacterized protein LOC114361723 isoform X1 [Ostrinia furnacalis]XP_028172667.1 uncharacterized protein LOC114361723 isoform X2 [Ostrinia furnacalis]